MRFNIFSVSTVRNARCVLFWIVLIFAASVGPLFVKYSVNLFAISLFPVIILPFRRKTVVFFGHHSIGESHVFFMSLWIC